MKKDIVWNSGQPPHFGWWLTDDDYHRTDADQWRWWDGYFWSVACFDGDDEQMLNAYANIKASVTGIRWSDYWPEGARVPRINP